MVGFFDVVECPNGMEGPHGVEGALWHGWVPTVLGAPWRGWIPTVLGAPWHGCILMGWRVPCGMVGPFDVVGCPMA